jgi:hypothetical protein
METKTQRFETDTLIEGLDVYGIDFSSRFHFGDDIYNCSNARGEGVGPRYGMAPLPGHATENVATGSLYGGLRASEGAGTYAYENRKKIFGIVPISIGRYGGNIASFDEIKDQRTHYIFVCSSLVSGNNIFDYAINVVNDGGSANYVSDIAQGFTWETLTKSGLLGTIGTRYRSLRPTPTEYRTIAGTRNWCRTVAYNHQGKNLVKTHWIGAVDSAYPDTANRYGLPYFGYQNAIAIYGQPPCLNYGTWSKGTRSIKLWSIGYVGSAGLMIAQWNLSDKIVSSLTYLPTLNSQGGANKTNLNTADWPNATKINPDTGARGGTGNSQLTLLYDPEMTINSQYQIILSAPGKALAAIIQEHERGDDRQIFRWIDLTSPLPFPSSLQTWNEGALATPYTEDSRQVQTCWFMWPSTAYDQPLRTRAALEAANQRNGSYSVCLGESGSGILRGNSTYEITFSLYDYTTDYETNVGAPAKIRTGSDDSVCLYLLLWPTVSGGRPNPGTNEFLQSMMSVYFNAFPASNSEQNRRINYQEYRIYYRELGTFEWLPAGKISMTEVFFHPDKTHFAVCESPIAALPGGQPGAFIDYSPLPSDQWEDVAIFNQRTFWMSKRQLSFSLKDNPLAYPARNSVSCPRGEFRGMIVHTFKGEAETTGRLVIFGSQETYFGEFNGLPFLFPVRVSENTVGEYPLDGSDFSVRLRSTMTSFSGKSAVVADGVLYFWGPQGIFADDGVDLPQRISTVLEPDLFGWYSLGDTDAIVASYNSHTKEVVFYFTPSTGRGTEPTHGLCYNVKFGKWLYYKFDSRVDWAQELTIENSIRTRRMQGKRLLLGTRENSSGVISRPAFFDHLCNSGDFGYGYEFMVRQVVALGGDNFLFRLGAGFPAAKVAQLITGDLISTPNMSDYSEMTNCNQNIWVVVSKDSVLGEITVQRNPNTSPAQTATSLTFDLQFPLYTSRHNRIPWILESNQWAPGGIRNFYNWYFTHMLFLTQLLESFAAQTMVMQTRTNVSAGYQSRTLTLADNSRGHFQVLSQIIPENMAHFGQSLQLKLTGNHIGGLLLLQYFGVECERLPLTETQIFEG